jgi:hypothetical protein
VDYCGIHLVRVFQAATLLGLLRTLARGISIAARLVAANLNALHGDWPETGLLGHVPQKDLADNVMDQKPTSRPCRRESVLANMFGGRP